MANPPESDELNRGIQNIAKQHPEVYYNLHDEPLFLNRFDNNLNNDPDG
jgi:hypothetical protein